MATKPIPPEKRFWPKVRVSDEYSCWEWVGSKDACGYGVLFRSDRTAPRMFKAHRLSWEIHNGPIPNGLHVLHKCDNPKCVNPSHLWLGTQADNNKDRDAKGRCRSKGGHVADQRGIKNGNARLSDEMVLQIRKLRELGKSQQWIADHVGCSQSQVSRIVRLAQRA